jgi:hypothetical protein
LAQHWAPWSSRVSSISCAGSRGSGTSSSRSRIKALKREYRVLSRSTHHLLKNLHAARASGTHPRLLTKVLNADLLILDDFGLHPLTPQAAQNLYEIISERYERGSMIITSNRAFQEWAEVFNNDLLASAALDRLTSGFVYEFWNGDIPKYMKATGHPSIISGLKASLNYPLVFEPGERWDYGIGIDWLGQVVEAVEGPEQIEVVE